jgi:hypothetical protein
VKFDVLTAMLRKNHGFWDVMPWLLVNSYRYFGGASRQQINALSCSETKANVYQPTGYNCPDVLNPK